MAITLYYNIEYVVYVCVHVCDADLANLGITLGTSQACYVLPTGQGG